MPAASQIYEAYKLIIQENKNSSFTGIDWDDLSEQLRSKFDKEDFNASIESNLSFLQKTYSTVRDIQTRDADSSKTIRDCYEKEDADAHILRVQVTYLLVCAQTKYNQEVQNIWFDTQLNDPISKCKYLLEVKTDSNPQEVILKYTENEYITGFFAFFFAIELGREVDKTVQNLSSDDIITLLNKVNEKRLYGVWLKSFVMSLMTLLPPDFYHVQSGMEGIQESNKYMGNLSWMLYFFRFGLNISLLIDYVQEGDPDHKWDRFLTQWEQRKFLLLNDFFWGIGNFFTFFWLVGKGALGSSGDALTIGLLLFDISMVSLDFDEQKTRYNKEILDFEAKITELNKLLEENKNNDEIEQETKRIIQLQIAALKEAKNKCSNNWDMQKISLITNVSYAVGLMCAFLVMTLPFIPIAGPAAIILPVAGAAISLAFTVINNAIRGGIELYKDYENKKDIDKELKAKEEEFQKLLRGENPDENKLKLLYLEIMRLKINSQYQKDMITYHALHLARSIAIDAMFPAFMFTLLVFLPLPHVIVIPIMIVVVLTLAITTYWLINSQFTPEKLNKLEGRTVHWMAKKPENMDNYKGGYIFFKEEQQDKLYYVPDSGEPVSVKIENTQLFSSELSKLKGSKEEGSVFLTGDQIKKMITLNGGHTPPEEFPEIEYEKYKKDVQVKQTEPTSNKCNRNSFLYSSVPQSDSSDTDENLDAYLLNK